MQELSDVSGLCQDLGVGVLVNEVNQVDKDPLNVADLVTEDLQVLLHDKETLLLFLKFAKH